MSEAPSAIRSDRGSDIAIYVTLTFLYGLITYLVLVGKPENSLHQSALSWAFLMASGVFVSAILGYSPQIIAAFRK